MSYPNIIEFHNELINLIYPIGSIYMSVNNVSPQTFLGGSWEQIKDRFLLSAGSSYTAGSTGGSSTVTLTTAQMPSHTHTTDSQGAHTHTRGTMNITGVAGTKDDQMNSAVSGAFYKSANVAYDASSSASGSGWRLAFDASRNWTGATSSNGAHTHTAQATGSGAAHDNMPPYLTVYMWKRIS